MAPIISNDDPLAAALARKAALGGAGSVERRIVAAGEGWRIVDFICICGPCDVPFEERAAEVSMSLVLSGTFRYRGDHGAVLLSPGAVLLANADRPFECSHAHGEGDRCLSFQFAPALFERLACDAGAARASAQALQAAGPRAEEIAFGFAGAVVRAAGEMRREPAVAGDCARIARVLRALGTRTAAPHARRARARRRAQPVPFPAQLQGGNGRHAAPVAAARAVARCRTAPRREPRAGDRHRARRRLRGSLQLHPQLPRRVRHVAAPLAHGGRGRGPAAAMRARAVVRSYGPGLPGPGGR